jgi:hypothetical protein
MSACDGAVTVTSAAKREASSKSRMIKVMTVLFTAPLLHLYKIRIRSIIV